MAGRVTASPSEVVSSINAEQQWAHKVNQTDARSRIASKHEAVENALKCGEDILELMPDKKLDENLFDLAGPQIFNLLGEVGK